ncbi:MAG: nicotinate-nicotinamide nucleotide adenylyltransferase [Candidatus Binatia bacterium]
MTRPEFYDLKRLFRLRDALESLKKEFNPKTVCSRLVDASDFERVGILSGSFNPPTIAHLELARSAKESFNLDRVFFTLGLVTVDKERIEGPMLEDRLLLLELLAAGLDWAAVAIVNRGLYFEQARAFRSLLGKSARISFVAGMDKLIQIFDARYYQDREAALQTLLTESQLVVAMRGNLGMSDLEQILNRTENEPYRDRVFPLVLPREVKEISSSALRREITAGRDFQGHVPHVVAEFIAETKAYLPAYDLRLKLIDRLFALREWAEGRVDFRKLAEKAQENDHEGSRLRKLLGSSASNEEFKELISALT